MTDQQPSRAVAVRRDTDTWVDVLPAVGDLAAKLAPTDFVPRDLRGKPAAVAAAILTGRELMLGPMAALRGLQVIDGTVSMTPEMMAARILAAGHSIQWVEASDRACTVRIVRGDGLSEAEARFTLADAQRAGLAGKRNWQQWPGQMCRARALANAARMACPDVILGLDVADQGAAPASQPEERWTAVQVRQHEEVEAAPPTGDEAAAPADATVAATPDTTGADPVDTVTPAQLRKLNAQVTDLERSRGGRLSRDERRALILQAAGADADLESATGLTRVQASTAIDTLEQLLAGQADVVEAEAVADPEPS